MTTSTNYKRTSRVAFRSRGSVTVRRVLKLAAADLAYFDAICAAARSAGSPLVPSLGLAISTSLEAFAKKVTDKPGIFPALLARYAPESMERAALGVSALPASAAVPASAG